MLQTQLSPKQQEKRAALLRSAKQLFIRAGFDAAKIQEISTGAGVAAGTFYLYFKDKHDLLTALVRQELVSAFEAAAPLVEAQPDAPSKLRCFLERYFAILTGDKQGVRLVILALTRGDHEFSQAIQPMRDYYLQRLEQILREGIEQGCFRPDLDLRTTAICLDGVVFWNVYIPQFLEGKDVQPARLAETVYQLVMAGISNPAANQ